MKKYIYLLYFALLLRSSSFAFDSTKNEFAELDLKLLILDKLKNSHNVELNLFVMSMCPYGVEAEKKLIYVLKEIKADVTFNLYYIASEGQQGFSSMHGEPEILENRRQLVIKRHFAKKFHDYLLARSMNYSSDEWQKAALDVDLDPKLIEKLVGEWAEVEAFRDNILQSGTKEVFASPTLFINGEQFKGSLSTTESNAPTDQCELSKVFCNSSTPCPKVCKTVRPDQTDQFKGKRCRDYRGCGTDYCVGGNPGSNNDGAICEVGAGGDAEGICTRSGGRCVHPVCDVDACIPSPGSAILSNVSVTATCETNQVLLKWKGSDEINAENFVVEKSTDGLKWQHSGDVIGLPDSSVEPAYSFTEVTGGDEINFYRLIIHRRNGYITYTSLVASPCKSKQQLHITPNPISTTASVNFPALNEEIAVITVVNAKGVTVQRMTKNLHVGDNQFKLDMIALPRGNYSITISSKTVRRTKQIMKN